MHSGQPSTVEFPLYLISIPYYLRLVALEVLDITLMFFGGVQCFKRPEVLTPFCFRIFLPRINPVIT
jgi:hypothetical protein